MKLCQSNDFGAAQDVKSPLVLLLLLNARAKQTILS